MTRVTAVTAAIALTACIKTVAPGPPVPHSPMQVNAPLEKTWDAVIDVFASKNIPVKTLDHSSGFIVAEEMRVPPPEKRGEASAYADCGSYNRIPLFPTRANYNIRVKGDSTRSSVQVTVFWKNVYDLNTGATTDCSTSGVWETDAETEIKKRAEQR